MDPRRRTRSDRLDHLGRAVSSHRSNQGSRALVWDYNPSAAASKPIRRVARGFRSVRMGEGKGKAMVEVVFKVGSDVSAGAFSFLQIQEP